MNNPFEPINARLSNLEALMLETLQLLRSATSTPSAADDETPLTTKQAADFLNVSRQTVYQNKAAIPRHKRHGQLYFFKADLLAYLKKEA